MNSVVSTLLTMHGPAVYAAITVLVFLEAAAFVGLVIPSETAVIVGGILASRGNLSVQLLAGMVTVAAVVGDSLGYLIGRRLGPAIQRSRAGRWIGTTRWDKVNAYVQRRGAWAVVLGRWVGLMRALVPATAGMVRLPYRRFLAANVVGAVGWVVGVLAVSYLAAGSIGSVQGSLGVVSTISVATIALVGVAGVVLRRRRRAKVLPGQG